MAVIGCGAIADSLHLPASRWQRQVTITCVIDRDETLARALAERYDIPRHGTGLEDCLDVDAVLLATPPHTRVELVREAADRGWHILAEKPIANSTAECLAQVEAANTARVMFAAAHVYRFWASRQRIHEIIRDHEYGDVVRVTVSQGKPYSWKSVTGYTVRKELVPGGVLINAGIHPLDSLLWWLGDPIDVEYHDDALGGLESNFQLRMTFASGTVARLRMSRTTELRHMIRIETTDAVLELPTYATDHFFLIRGGNTQRIACGEKCDSGPEHLRPACQQFMDFAQAVAGRGPPRVSGEEGTRVIRLIERCYQLKRTRPLPAVTPAPGELW
jgi:predicted dehydrogenase